MKLPEWASNIIAAVVLAVVGFVYKLIQRVDRIETLDIERDKRLEKVESKVDKHDELVTHISTLVTEFKEAMPGFKEVGQVASRLEGVIDMQNRRLELVENVMLGRTPRHMS